MTAAKRVGLYLRVSTGNGDQTVENQRQALTAAAERRGWQIVAEFCDDGISGAKGRDRRPAFDRLHKAIVRREIDVIAAWSVDRLGRSLQDLVAFLGAVSGAGGGLYLDRRRGGTSTAAGEGVFCVLGGCAESARGSTQARRAARVRR